MIAACCDQAGERYGKKSGERIGLIADVQRASIHDGSGFRTTVFFKGCPLKCAWCHNPECISFEKQTLFYPEKCIGCGQCEKGCFTGARVICGKEYSVEVLLEEILQDKDYYGNEGGVTFSGGEPLAQRKFLSKVIDACHSAGVLCSVETSLIFYEEEIFKKLDLVMADLKIWDDELHRLYTGVSNQAIKENFKKLNCLGIPIIARTPVMMEIEQGVDKISAFLKELENVRKYELLPYHPLGNSKQEALGKAVVQFQKPDNEFMKRLNQYVFSR